MYKFTEAEIYSLMAFNVFQYREGARSKEQLLETCRMLKDELNVQGQIRGYIMVIQTVLNDTYSDALEDMLMDYDDGDNPSYRLIMVLYMRIKRGELSKDELLKNTADAIMIDALDIFHNGDKESFYDMLHILTDKIERLGAEQ